MKLSIAEIQVGKDKAEKYILNLCKELGLQINTRKELSKTIRFNSSDKIIEINFPKEIDYVRKNGRAFVLQIMADSNDHYLNMSHGISVSSNARCGKIKLESNYGSHSVVVGSHSLIQAPEISFSDDISFYRKQAVIKFNENDLPGFARAYRGYLQSCVSLLDCFVHRYTFHIKSMIPSMKEYENTEVLDSKCSLEERLDAWVYTFATHKMDEYKNSKYRSKFIELKTKRNEIVHAIQPHIAYDIKESVKYLNYVQDGVGGFMAELRKYSGFSENVGFIRHVKTQAEIKIINT
ncbi:hypothetical protein [Methylomonas methanica]|uniref:Apea-like HEPN domain-containing protein n=1 Tax=Methylomonas methanica (strain DSM 25384 / MC09) TaxID=857087 RepID=F9ZZH8_METMM|nr:hypothetical protein [Methylomonas methanica]AEG02371.1 hypothetical protein Metme_4018 [Methylomonas methanica MC09]